MVQGYHPWGKTCTCTCMVHLIIVILRVMFGVLVVAIVHMYICGVHVPPQVYASNCSFEILLYGFSFRWTNYQKMLLHMLV